ncbi:hypothetical protein D3C71_2057240 [compost metagenome]
MKGMTKAILVASSVWIAGPCWRILADNAFSRSKNSISHSSLRCHILVAQPPYWQLQITARDKGKRHMSE